MNKSNKFRLLKTSLRYQGREFMQNSTLHGISYIADEYRPFHERFVWFSFLLTGSLATLVIIISLWEKFQTSPTITGLDTDFHSWDVPFPAVTICFTDPTDSSRVEYYITERWGNITEEEFTYYKTFINDVSALSYNNLDKVGKYSADKRLPQDDLRKIVSQTVIRCEDFISQCIWKGESFNCCMEFFPTFTDQGFCYSFNSKHFDVDLWSETDSRRNTVPVVKYIYETDSEFYVSFLINKQIPGPFVIYINSAEEKIGQDLPPQHIWNRRVQKIYFMPKATYTTEETKQLSIKQRHCVFPDEVPLITDDIYTFGACMAQCRIQMSHDKCGCIPFFYKEIGVFKHCSLEGLTCLSKYKKELLKPVDCDCELGCMTTVYEVEKLDDSRIEVLHPLEITFVSWPMIRYKRDVLFGWVDLFVAFGGIAGLFLGFSLLSGIEIIYYFTLRVLCMIHRDQKDLERIQEEYDNTPSPEIDLQMKPRFLRDKNESLQIDKSNQLTKTDIYVMPYIP